jgi:hypothetical protein
VIFYFNRENGQRVSKSTWKRSKAQGGKRFVRRSSKGRVSATAPTGVVPGPSTPSQKAHKKNPNPKTFQEYMDTYLDYGETDEMIEIETGVDY